MFELDDEVRSGGFSLCSPAYGLWAESVVATMHEIDPSYDLVVEHAWRLMMGNVISYMTRRD